MKLSTITPPAIEPVTLAEAKAHARIFADLTDDDPLVTSLIVAAREKLESMVARAFITQTLEETRFAVPEGGRIRLLRAPVRSIESVVVDGVTLDPSAYSLFDGTPGWLTFAKPPASNAKAVVRYIAGYGDDAASVPEVAKLTIKILASHFYDRREPIATGTIVAKIPFAAEALSDALRWGGSYPR
jgi:uncharacterized phiE125 gp8 family phage protein